MKFEEAERRLGELAKERYYTLSFEKAIFPKRTIRPYDIQAPREVENRCKLYVDGYDIYSGPTWKKAFKKLEEAMGLTVQGNADPEPEEEA
jgi:hypothetical protein